MSIIVTLFCTETTLKNRKKKCFKSFHVGSGVRDPESYAAAIRASRQVFDQASKLGFQMDLLDIGGGFPGDMYAAIVPQFEKVGF